MTKLFKNKAFLTVLAAVLVVGIAVAVILFATHRSNNKPTEPIIQAPEETVVTTMAPVTAPPITTVTPVETTVPETAPAEAAVTTPTETETPITTPAEPAAPPVTTAAPPVTTAAPKETVPPIVTKAPDAGLSDAEKAWQERIANAPKGEGGGGKISGDGTGKLSGNQIGIMD